MNARHAVMALFLAAAVAAWFIIPQPGPAEVQRTDRVQDVTSVFREPMDSEGKSTASTEDALPTGAWLFDRHLEATGGAAANLAVHSMEITSRVEVEGFSCTQVTVFQEPWKMRWERTCGASITAGGFDGDVAWTLDGSGATPDPTFTLAESRRLHDLHAEVNVAALYKGLETLGEEDKEGQPTYAVLATATDGLTEKHWFHRETGFRVARESRRHRRGETEVLRSTTYADQRVQNALSTAWTWVTTQVEQPSADEDGTLPPPSVEKQTFTITRIRCNLKGLAPIEAPADVREQLVEHVLMGQVLLHGKPQVGARVSVLMDDGTRLEQQTQEQGQFGFSAVHGRTYSVEASHGLAEGSIRGSLPTQTTLEGLVVKLAMTAGIRGTVTDEHGQPLEHVHVTTARRSTDVNGHYELRCDVHPEVPRAAAETRCPVRVEQDGYLPFCAWVTTRPGAWVEQDVTLVPAATARGVVVDARDRPVPGVSVRLERHRDEQNDEDEAHNPAECGRRDRAGGSATSEEDGSFVFQHLPPGKYVLTVPARGAQPEVSVLLPSSAMRVQLNGGGEIRVHVEDENGRPMGAVGVHASDPLVLEEGHDFEGSCTTREDGVCSILGVPAGTYTVEATAADPETGLPIEVRAKVNVEAGPPVKVLLRMTVDGALVLAGRVVDSNGKPRAGVRVTATSETNWRGGRHGATSEPTNLAGAFHLRVSAPGPHRLAVRAQSVLHGAVANAGDHHVELVVPAVVRVMGNVVDAEGAPVTDFEINGSAHSDHSDAAGLFDTELIRSGDAVLVFSAWHRASATVNLGDVTGQDVVNAGTITLGKGRVLTGTVLAHGAGLEGAMVHCGDLLASTDARGRFVLEGIPEKDAVLVVADAKPLSRRNRRLNVADGQAHVNVDLGAGARITLRLLDQAGKPLEDGSICLVCDDGGALCGDHGETLESVGVAGPCTAEARGVDEDLVLAPRRVNVPQSGAFTVELRASAESGVVRVTLVTPENQPADAGTLVVMEGAVPYPTDASGMFGALRSRRLNRVDGDPPVFEARVSPGLHTLFVTRVFGGELWLLRQEFSVDKGAQANVTMVLDAQRAVRIPRP